jgi:Trk-type K+ transport system membrane component
MGGLPPEQQQHNTITSSHKISIMATATVVCLGLMCFAAASFLSGLSCFDPYSASCPPEETRHHRWALAIMLLLGGLAFTTLLAFAIGLPKTGIAYAAVTITLAILLSQNGYTRDSFRTGMSSGAAYEYESAHVSHATAANSRTGQAVS